MGMDRLGSDLQPPSHLLSHLVSLPGRKERKGRDGLDGRDGTDGRRLGNKCLHLWDRQASPQPLMASWLNLACLALPHLHTHTFVPLHLPCTACCLCHCTHSTWPLPAHHGTGSRSFPTLPLPPLPFALPHTLPCHTYHTPLSSVAGEGRKGEGEEWDGISVEEEEKEKQGAGEWSGGGDSWMVSPHLSLSLLSPLYYYLPSTSFGIPSAFLPPLPPLPSLPPHYHTHLHTHTTFSTFSLPAYPSLPTYLSG